MLWGSQTGCDVAAGRSLDINGMHAFTAVHSALAALCRSRDQDAQKECTQTFKLKFKLQRKKTVKVVHILAIEMVLL